ncbi:amidohydrolase [Halioxenophilus sp. WMMB6]|uniref:amidohydrolase n=1 Tax=Halioxenophilus sp. WMMB6 TaxID=3073815 RepID=UPI00295EAC4F|nr:amidohydrolase [Halioxenophilus sp. WMMB6]
MLVKNIHSLVTCDDHNRVLHDVDLLIENGIIKAIGNNIIGHPEDTLIDGRQLLVYPGLINTHHHFFQSLVRNRVDLDWSQLSLLQWLQSIYPIFAKMDEECIYQATIIALAELIKSGCTTAFDHQYNYSKNAGSRVIDRQFEAAQLFGIRLHAGRGTNTLPMHEGSTIPDLMCETTDQFIDDCERLIGRYHDPRWGSMRQVVVAPCQPINCYPETFREAAALARAHDVSMHTHLGEGEKAALQARSGLSSIDWCIKQDFFGPTCWYAHGWEFSEPEIEQLASSNTGISHCPAPVFLVGAEITNVSYMQRQGLRLGLGVDGAASNDNSNLAECLRSAYLLQCLKAKELSYPIAEAREYLTMATRGSAACLNRPDLGQLKEGLCGDFFAINCDRLEYAATLHDPMALPVKVGINGPVDLTVINGRIVWQNGEFPYLDEAQLVARATEVANALMAR